MITFLHAGDLRDSDSGSDSDSDSDSELALRKLQLSTHGKQRSL